MASRRDDQLGFASVLSHLGVMVAVSAVLGVLVAGVAIPFAGVLGLTAKSVAEGMDSLPAELTAEPLPERTRVLDRDGNLVATFYDENRVNVPLARVAPIMRKAIIAIEDYRFYEHGALDIKGTLRAFITNQANDGVVQGGSSITQQMVKMTLVNQADTKAEIRAATEETYERKLNELRYAIAFEEKYSKQWILERYLNIAYFGDGAYGIEAASQHYFSKPASELELREAAMLAGLVQNPTAYDPTNDPENAEQRRDVVLNRMAELNVISASELEEAKSKGLGLKVRATNNGCVDTVAAWFCDYVREYLLLDEDLGRTREDREQLLTSGGLTITTTIDLRMQRAADESVREHVNPTDQAIGGLALVEPRTGEVRALAQSRPMGRNKKKGETFLNYVVPKEYGDANGFQAGSTFKPFVLAAAIDQGIPLTTQIYSPQQVSIPNSRYKTCDGNIKSTETWEPQNSTGSGTFDLYSGTQQSVNTFFAQLEARTGLCQPVQYARDMGVEVPDDQVVPSFTLGVVNTDPLTMSAAYATFAARGTYCEPQPVVEILDKDGELLKEYSKRCERVMPKAVADAVNDILRGVQEPGGFGYGAGLNLEQPSAGKTGTINSNMAVWFVGYTPNMSAAAMLAGANQQGHWTTLNGQVVGGQYISSAAGSTNAGPIWGDAMQAIQGILPDQDFQVPDPTVVKGRSVTVPSLGGQTTRAAAEALRKLGLVPEIGPLVDSSYAYGTVAYLSPGSGSSIGSGSTVTIYVSDGTPYVPPAPPPSDDFDDDSDSGGSDGGGDGGSGDGPGNSGGGPGNGNGNGRGNGGDD